MSDSAQGAISVQSGTEFKTMAQKQRQMDRSQGGDAARARVERKRREVGTPECTFGRLLRRTIRI
jgi:hypothetical protein